MAEKILFVNACVRAGSRTLELARCVLEKLSGQVEQVDLYENVLCPLDRDALEKRAAQAYADPIFAPAKAFALADIIVIAAPYWDLMFPAVLKTYLETVTVSGITFRYSEKGIPEGLCRARKLYYITTAGGYMGENTFGFSYVKALAQSFYGIREVRYICAEGLDIVGNDAPAILENAKQKIRQSL